MLWLECSFFNKAKIFLILQWRVYFYPMNELIPFSFKKKTTTALVPRYLRELSQLFPTRPQGLSVDLTKLGRPAGDLCTLFCCLGDDMIYNDKKENIAVPLELPGGNNSRSCFEEFQQSSAETRSSPLGLEMTCRWKRTHPRKTERMQNARSKCSQFWFCFSRFLFNWTSLYSKNLMEEKKIGKRFCLVFSTFFQHKELMHNLKDPEGTRERA